MNWLSLALALVKVIAAVFDYIRTRQLISQGEALQLARELQHVNSRMAAYAEIDRRVSDLTDDAVSSELQKYRRD